MNQVHRTSHIKTLPPNMTMGQQAPKRNRPNQRDGQMAQERRPGASRNGQLLGGPKGGFLGKLMEKPWYDEEGEKKIPAYLPTSRPDERERATNNADERGERARGLGLCCLAKTTWEQRLPGSPRTWSAECGLKRHLPNLGTILSVGERIVTHAALVSPFSLFRGNNGA